MSSNSALIDQIVRDVLTQLAGGVVPMRAETSTTSAARDPATAVEIADRVITADLLAARLDGTTRVIVSPRAIVTPAAWDLVREQGITIQRADARPAANGTAQLAAPAKSATSLPLLLLIVRSTPAVDRLYEDLKATCRRELLGCPDDAAKLAISAVARGETNSVIILAAQTHRAACLANRHDAAKAVAVRNAADVPVVRKQLRANVWCVDPTEKSWFELRNILRAIGP